MSVSRYLATLFVEVVPLFLVSLGHMMSALLTYCLRDILPKVLL